MSSSKRSTRRAISACAGAGARTWVRRRAGASSNSPNTLSITAQQSAYSCRNRARTSSVGKVRRRAWAAAAARNGSLSSKARTSPASARNRSARSPLVARSTPTSHGRNAAPLSSGLARASTVASLSRISSGLSPSSRHASR